MSNFWKKVLIIGIPVALQNLINNLLNMIDTLMLSSLSGDYVPAVGFANKIFFVFSLLTFGITSGCSVLTSQFYGKGDNKGLNKSFGFSIVLALSAGLIFGGASILIPKTLMTIFTADKNMIEIGAGYLRICGISYIFTSVSFAIVAMLKSVNRTNIPMFVTICCVCINLIVNYIFIFGKFGAPMLKARGAAYGTVIARAVELTALILYLKFAKKDFKLKIKDMFSFDKPFKRRIIKVSWPVIANEFGWGLGTMLYSVIYGRMPNAHPYVMTVAAVIQDLAWAFLLGISNACAIIVGNQLGASRFEDAKKSAGKLLKANFLLGLGIGIVLVLISPIYPNIYQELSSVERKYLTLILIIFAISFPIKAFNLTNVCGVLRSGGDTVFCMALDIGGVWGVALPFGIISAFIFKAPLPVVYAFILSEELVKIFISYYRFRQYKWVRNIVHLNDAI